MPSKKNPKDNTGIMPPKYRYNGLSQYTVLGTVDTAAIKQKDFSDLIQQAKNEPDPEKALQFTAKLSLLYGVPGLIWHYKTYLKLIEAAKSHDPVDVASLSEQALKWLLLAEKLLQLDKERASEDIKKYCPELRDNLSSFFKAGKQQLVENFEPDEASKKQRILNSQNGANKALEKCRPDIGN